MPVAPPNAAALAGIEGSTTRVTRRIEILNSDGTVWKNDAGLLGGSVGISNSRKERRTFDITLDNQDRSLDNYPGGFWYDKIVKLYRGAESDNFSYEAQLGEFMIDNIDAPHFPWEVHVNGRDRTKQLILAKFSNSTTFASGQAPETLIRTIALNAGITRFIFPTTGKTITQDVTYERDVERWEAMSQIAEPFSYELYFDAQGYLVMAPFTDPVVAPTSWVFQTGLPSGNLASYRKSSSDTRIHNVVSAIGASTGQLVPVSYTAQNTQPGSPTNVATLGPRVFNLPANPLLQTVGDAEAMAIAFLKIAALESFEVSFESIVFPWLDVNQIIQFIDPYPIEGQPDRFLLTDLTIPLSLGPMTGTAKRVSVVWQ